MSAGHRVSGDKDAGHNKASKDHTPVKFRFRNPIIVNPETLAVTGIKKPRFLGSETGQSHALKNVISDDHIPNKLKTSQSEIFDDSTLNLPKIDTESAERISISLPPNFLKPEYSPFSGNIDQRQNSFKPLQQENKKSVDLLLSPSEPSVMPPKPDSRRFSLGIFADNQLPLSAVYDHNLMGSELGNEFSSLNEFLNLLDPAQKQLDVYASLNTPITEKSNHTQINHMSPASTWMNSNNNIPTPGPNTIRSMRSPMVFRELPNILESSAPNETRDNGVMRQIPGYEKGEAEYEPDYRHHPHQKSAIQRSKFTRNYTRHNFPTLKNSHSSHDGSPNSSIYDGNISKQNMRPPKKIVKKASYTVSAKENFFLTAAAPSAVLHAKERLTEVIKAKLEAGLLKPYDYSKGYDRIHHFLTDSGTTMAGKQRVYKVLNDLRPQYAKLTSNLKSVDLVLVEESFEVMLLSLERVFSTIATPSCCWRRTGEIYRGNQEFATLAGCDIEDLRDGQLGIYELMDEESYCKYFELFGYSSLKPAQKSVLTHCNLKNREVKCCFSFTIKRDEYNIPICIIGNFLPSE